MRLAYKRYAGERGFTPEQFRMTAEEVAGVDLKDWFRRSPLINRGAGLHRGAGLVRIAVRASRGTAERNDEAGQQKDEPAKKEEPAKKDEPSRKWKLEVRADSTEAQKARTFAGCWSPPRSR